ncbi:MAG: hypothetical protein ACTS42_01785 [Candidatus Hodgkinia cicadicola]
MHVSVRCAVERGRFLRVTHPDAAHSLLNGDRTLNLHVLGLPPAFVLSQDQALSFKVPFQMRSNELV